MDQYQSQSEEHSSHPRDNSIPSEAKEENSQQSNQQDNHTGRPPSDNFALKKSLYIFAALLFASIASGDFRSAALNAIVGYVIVNSFDYLRKGIKK